MVYEPYEDDLTQRARQAASNEGLVEPSRRYVAAAEREVTRVLFGKNIEVDEDDEDETESVYRGPKLRWVTRTEAVAPWRKRIIVVRSEGSGVRMRGVWTVEGAEACPHGIALVRMNSPEEVDEVYSDRAPCTQLSFIFRPLIGILCILFFVAAAAAFGAKNTDLGYALAVLAVGALIGEEMVRNRTYIGRIRHAPQHVIAAMEEFEKIGEKRSRKKKRKAGRGKRNASSAPRQGRYTPPAGPSEDGDR